jgi:DNA-binding NtrC family response regulator
MLTTLTAALHRELELLRATVTANQTDAAGGTEALFAEATQLGFRLDFYKEVERYEIALIKTALRHASGSQRKAAELLAMNSTTLNAKIKHYGIHVIEVTAHYSSRLDGARRPGSDRSAQLVRDRVVEDLV